MLKIYQAYADRDEIKIKDQIDFRYGQFDTGLNGFGQVKSGNLSVSRANYELQTLKSFREYLKTVKTIDGYVDDFAIWNPMTYKMLEEKYKDISKDFDTYEEYGLNEEGILLFTDYVRLMHSNDDSVQRIFGRYPENGMYLIMPNASFSMARGTFGGDVTENYEVLQSQSLGRQLVLTKMNRKI